jgi:hypothetical protein
MQWTAVELTVLVQDTCLANLVKAALTDVALLSAIAREAGALSGSPDHRAACVVGARAGLTGLIGDAGATFVRVIADSASAAVRLRVCATVYVAGIARAFRLPRDGAAGRVKRAGVVATDLVCDAGIALRMKALGTGKAVRALVLELARALDDALDDGAGRVDWAAIPGAGLIEHAAVHGRVVSLIALSADGPRVAFVTCHVRGGRRGLVDHEVQGKTPTELVLAIAVRAEGAARAFIPLVACTHDHAIGVDAVAALATGIQLLVHALPVRYAATESVTVKAGVAALTFGALIAGLAETLRGALGARHAQAHAATVGEVAGVAERGFHVLRGHQLVLTTGAQACEPDQGKECAGQVAVRCHGHSALAPASIQARIALRTDSGRGA